MEASNVRPSEIIEIKHRQSGGKIEAVVVLAENVGADTKAKITQDLKTNPAVDRVLFEISGIT